MFTFYSLRTQNQLHIVSLSLREMLRCLSGEGVLLTTVLSRDKSFPWERPDQPQGKEEQTEGGRKGRKRSVFAVFAVNKQEKDRLVKPKPSLKLRFSPIQDRLGDFLDSVCRIAEGDRV